MESKLLIDVDYEMRPCITVRQKTNAEVVDVKDRLVQLFVQKAAPEGMAYDGFARVSRLSVLPDGTAVAEIIPIHPTDMPKWIDHINESAAKWKTGLEPYARTEHEEGAKSPATE